MTEIIDPKLQVAFDKYCIWRSIPRHFHNLVEGATELEGLDPEVMEMVQIHTQKAFCEKFDVTNSALHGWAMHPEFESRTKKSWKAWARGLTPNVIHKLYQKIMDEGDAPRVKAWAQLVEDQQDNIINVDIGISRVKDAMREDGDFQSSTATANVTDVKEIK